MRTLRGSRRLSEVSDESSQPDARTYHSPANGGFEAARNGVPRLVGWRRSPGHLGALREVIRRRLNSASGITRSSVCSTSCQRESTAQAKLVLCHIPCAETRNEAERLDPAYPLGATSVATTLLPKTCATKHHLYRLTTWQRMATFYGFRREHWQHLRTTKPAGVTVCRPEA